MEINRFNISRLGKMPKKQAARHQKLLRECKISEENRCVRVAKLVEAENEAILVEVENRT